MTREDLARDSYGSWLLAINAGREQGIRTGRYQPKDEIERRQALQGPRKPHELDVVHSNTGGEKA